MGKGSGFGKVILFSEHFVVYGVPGIVSAIDSTAEARVKRTGDGIGIQDERIGAKGYSEKKKSQQKESIERMLNEIGVPSETASLKIWLGGNLPGFSGIGASAASSVAIARALADEYKLNFSDDEINKLAYEAEKAYAGTPSGIDNTAATYGGLLWFKRGLMGEPNIVEPLQMNEPVEIVIGNTGIVADTKEMVAGVAVRKKSNQEKYTLLFKQAEELAISAREAVKSFNLLKLGELMNQSHNLLQEIEVSCKSLDDLVNLSLEKGAFGAKLTGGGGGGCMVALTPGRENQETVATAIEDRGFKVLRTKIGIQTGGSLLKR